MTWSAFVRRPPLSAFKGTLTFHSPNPSLRRTKEDRPLFTSFRLSKVFSVHRPKLSLRQSEEVCQPSDPSLWNSPYLSGDPWYQMGSEQVFQFLNEFSIWTRLENEQRSSKNVPLVHLTYELQWTITCGNLFWLRMTASSESIFFPIRPIPFWRKTLISDRKNEHFLLLHYYFWFCFWQK